MPGQQIYEIQVEGHLDPFWLDWFEGVSLCHQPDGTSILHGAITDQAALHGLLSKIRDLGLPLVSVRRIDRDTS